MYRSLAHDTPSRRKGAVHRWLDDNLPDGMRRPLSHLSRSVHKGHLQETGRAIRGSGEALTTGAVLGYFHATMGLDLNVFGFKVPIDGLLGLVSTGSAVFLSKGDDGDGLSQDFRNIGQNAIAISTFRLMNSIVSERRIAKGGVANKLPGSVAGEFGEDPIIAAARNL